MNRHKIVLIGLALAVVSVAGARAATQGGPAQPQIDVQQSIAVLGQRVSALEDRMQSSGLLDLLNQVTELRQEIAQLRGTQEEQAHDLDQLDKREKDVYSDLNARITALAKQQQATPPLEPVKLQPSETLSVTPPSGTGGDETHAYEAALSLFRAGNYKASIAAFQAFLQKYPEATLSSNACYWMGLGQASLGDFKAATQSYQRILKDYPNSHKAPDAMLSLARIHIQQGKLPMAQDLLGQVVSKYPTSKAADNARKLLATFK
jgi:tol-pal system protein YbgF